VVTDNLVALRRFTMSQLVDRTGIPAATVRYYLASGLLPPPLKVSPNRFLYDERHAELLRLIRLVRDRRGLSIETIGKLLPELLPDLYDKPTTGVFHPEMWDQLLAAAARLGAGPPVMERIVAVGIGLFGARGYADVTIDDVCRTAEIAKGSFYRHFSSKEELFSAAVEESARKVAAAFVETSANDGGGRTSEVDHLALALSPHLVLFLDAASLAAQRRPGHARAYRNAVTTLTQAVAGVRGGDESPPEEDILTAALVAGVQRAVDPQLTVEDAQASGGARDSVELNRGGLRERVGRR